MEVKSSSAASTQTITTANSNSSLLIMKATGKSGSRRSQWAAWWVTALLLNGRGLRYGIDDYPNWLQCCDRYWNVAHYGSRRTRERVEQIVWICVFTCGVNLCSCLGFVFEELVPNLVPMASMMFLAQA